MAVTTILVLWCAASMLLAPFVGRAMGTRREAETTGMAPPRDSYRRYKRLSAW